MRSGDSICCRLKRHVLPLSTGGKPACIPYRPASDFRKVLLGAGWVHGSRTILALRSPESGTARLEEAVEAYRAAGVDPIELFWPKSMFCITPLPRHAPVGADQNVTPLPIRDDTPRGFLGGVRGDGLADERRGADAARSAAGASFFGLACSPAGRGPSALISRPREERDGAQ
jgi:hypothetical protein